MSPIRAPIKSAPFPWNISKHFDGSGFSPLWISGVSDPQSPPPLQPSPPPPLLHYHHHLHHHLLSLSVTLSLCSQHIVCVSVTGSALGDSEGAEEGESCSKPFSHRSPGDIGWEEDALWAARRAWYGIHRLVLAVLLLAFGMLGSLCSFGTQDLEMSYCVLLAKNCRESFFLSLFFFYFYFLFI